MVWRYASLFQDGAQRAFGYIARMSGNGGVSMCGRVEPNFVAAGGLTVKLKAERFESLDDLAVAKSG